MNLLNLFRSKPVVAADGLTQPEREAIVDFLSFCLYADRHVAWAESEMLDRLVDRFNWSETSLYSDYLNGATLRVRQALEHPEARAVLLGSIGERLQSRKSRDVALKRCSELLRADGQVSPEEAAVLQELRHRLV